MLDSITPAEMTATAQTAEAYAALTCDYNPIHLDAEFAAATAFGRPIAHGTMALNLLIQAIEQSCAEGGGLTALDIRFSAPAYIGDRLRAGGARTGADGDFEVWVDTEDGRRVLSGSARIGA